jgi:anti-sigma factor RsiW
MNANHSPGSAVSDADLIRYLDGELDADESERIEAAIAGDDTVAGRLAMLSRRDRNLSALLDAVDPTDQETQAADPSLRVAGIPGQAASVSRGAAKTMESPLVRSIESGRRKRQRSVSAVGTTGARWLKAAVIIFALLGAGLLVPPVRAWIVDRLETIAGAEETGVEVSPEVTSEGGAAVSYGIPVTGAVLDVTLDEAQAGGELVVESADVPNARIEPLDAAAGDPVVVTSNAVRIDNGPASAGGYRLTVPRSVRSVRVRFGDDDAQSYYIGADPLTIPLTVGGV